MALDFKIPNVDALKALDDARFAMVAASSLGRYDTKGPGYNLAAEAGYITELSPSGQTEFRAPAEAKDLIVSGVAVLKEFTETGKVSRPAREAFIYADMKDLLRRVEGDHSSAEYGDACLRVLKYALSRLPTLNVDIGGSTPAPKFAAPVSAPAAPKA